MNVNPVEMTDAQLEKTDTFKKVKTFGLSEEATLGIARDILSQLWREQANDRLRSAIQALFKRRKDDTITIYRDEKADAFLPKTKGLRQVFEVLQDNGTRFRNAKSITFSRQGSCCLDVSGSNRTRFSHDDYARLIGRGDDTAKQQEMIDIFCRESNQSSWKPVFVGGFLMAKTGMRREEKNGIYELVLEPGDPNNALTYKFVAKLYQYTFDLKQHPVIIYPPASGDKSNPAASSEIVEVGSMSQLMKTSQLNGAMTPAVVFGLVEQLQKAAADRLAQHPKGTVAFR